MSDGQNERKFNGLLTAAQLLGASVPTKRVQLDMGDVTGDVLVRALPPGLVLRMQTQGEAIEIDCPKCNGMGECEQCESTGKVKTIDIAAFAPEILFRGMVGEDGRPMFDSIAEADDMLEYGDQSMFALLLEEITGMSKLNATAEEIKEELAGN